MLDYMMLTPIYLDGPHRPRNRQNRRFMFRPLALVFFSSVLLGALGITAVMLF